MFVTFRQYNMVNLKTSSFQITFIGHAAEVNWLYRFCFITVSWCANKNYTEIGDMNSSPTLQTAMTFGNQWHSGAVLQSKPAPVSSMSGPNSHIIALIMQLMLLTVFLIVF